MAAEVPPHGPAEGPPADPQPMPLLNITERAAELATICSFGWRNAALARLIVTEGAIIGLTGSLAGAGLGLGAAA